MREDFAKNPSSHFDLVYQKRLAHRSFMAQTDLQAQNKSHRSLLSFEALYHVICTISMMIAHLGLKIVKR